MPSTFPVPVVYIFGPTGSGKTHYIDSKWEYGTIFSSSNNHHRYKEQEMYLIDHFHNAAQLTSLICKCYDRIRNQSKWKNIKIIVVTGFEPITTLKPKNKALLLNEIVHSIPIALLKDNLVQINKRYNQDGFNYEIKYS